MRLTYLLESPELCGGVKVVFQHAELLQRAGHAVTIIGNGARPEWIPFAGQYLDRSRGLVNVPSQDLVIATWWGTVPLAETLAIGPVAHFCQGYEGGFSHLASQQTEIDAVYARRVPTFVVSPHLGDLLSQRFGRECRVTAPPLDPLFRSRWRWRPRRVPQIVIPGIFEAEVKGIPTALAAVMRLREAGQQCHVTRLSVFPLSLAEEETLRPDRYLCGITPAEVARLLRTSDLLLFPAQREEGFGLPVLEALASKLPVVASDIPSMSTLKTTRAVVTAPPGDAETFAVTMRRLLETPAEWRALRSAGAAAAQQFHPDAILPQLAAGVSWAATVGTSAATFGSRALPAATASPATRH